VLIVIITRKKRFCWYI